MITFLPLPEALEARITERERQLKLARAIGCEVGVRARKWIKDDTASALREAVQGRGN
jgi:hypothetical protein